MNKIQAKECLLWFVEQFNNYETWSDEDKINQIRSLLEDLAQGKIVTVIPFSDKLLYQTFPHDGNPHISHSTRFHYEYVGFNRACKVMIATGRMAKA